MDDRYIENGNTIKYAGSNCFESQGKVQIPVYILTQRIR